MKFIRAKANLNDLRRPAHGLGAREGAELMDRNERTADFPPEVMEALRRRLTPFLMRAYPEPGPLYEKLAAWLGLPTSMLLLCAGADGGLRSVFETFVEPGDGAVCLTPSYGMYPVYRRISGAVYQPVRFNNDLSISLDQIVERIEDRTKLVVLANPNQPIERVYAESDIRRLAEACARRDALLVMDEAYYPLGPSTALPWVGEYGNLVVVRSFSKAFGIAGVRLGYVVSQPENIENLTKVRPSYEVSSVAIAIAVYLLENDHLMWSYVAQVRDAMGYLVSGLNALGVPAIGRWGNSILVPLPADLPAVEMAEAVKQRGFRVRVESEPPLSNHLRVTVGPKDQAERFLAVFEFAWRDRRRALTGVAPGA